jgi:hypothetical protein
MTEEHIPVVPNIGTQKRTKRNIFSEDNIEGMSLPRKKIGILDIETQKTDEETAAKKESGSISWLFIVLIVVIIILLLTIIYYVVTKNSNKGMVIHPEVVRPMAYPSSQHMHKGNVASNAHHKVLEKVPNGPGSGSGTQHAEIARHQLYVEPTEEELNAALTQAQSKRELEEKYIEEISIDGDNVESKKQNSVNFTDMEKNMEKNIDENIENLIYDGEFGDDDGNINKVDPKEIDEFHKQVINYE